MLRVLCVVAVLGGMLACPCVAADKDFSWGDDSITSSGTVGASSHGWGDETFNVHIEETTPPVQKATDHDSLSGKESPVLTNNSSGGNTGDSSGLSWGDGIDTPETNQGATSASNAGWGDDIDVSSNKQQSANKDNNSDGGNGLSWGDDIDTPSPKQNESASSNAGWGDDIDTPSVKQSPANAGGNPEVPDISVGDNDTKGQQNPSPKPAGVPSSRGGVTLLVIDRDEAGTNVRDAPSGAKTQVIPLQYPGEVRPVVVSGVVSKGWFELIPGGMVDEGWVHRSVLGVCAGASHKGGADAYLEPNTDGPTVQIPVGLPLTPLEMKGEWMKVRIGMGDGGSDSECWVQNGDLIMNEEEMSDCALTWAGR